MSEPYLVTVNNDNPLAAELTRLRKENADLRDELDEAVRIIDSGIVLTQCGPEMAPEPATEWDCHAATFVHHARAALAKHNQPGDESCRH